MAGNIHEANAAMLIRKPVEEVFEAFTNPEITTKFWFSKSSGKLEAGKQVRWDWEMYGAHSDVTVKVFEKDKRILIEWSGYGSPDIVEWIFTSRPEGTFVDITNRGFSGTEEEIIGKVMDSIQGFNLLLAGAKALLEHNIQLNLVPDRYPDQIVRKG